jgi:hypothetical protein
VLNTIHAQDVDTQHGHDRANEKRLKGVQGGHMTDGGLVSTDVLSAAAAHVPAMSESRKTRLRRHGVRQFWMGRGYNLLQVKPRKTTGNATQFGTPDNCKVKLKALRDAST